MPRLSCLHTAGSRPLLACVAVTWLTGVAWLPATATADPHTGVDRVDAGSASISPVAGPLAAAPVDSLASLGQEPPVRQTALARDVRELLEAFNLRLAELTAGFEAAENQATAAAVQQEIAALKQDFEVQMLAIQLREARRRDPAANGELVAELELAIAAARERHPAAGDAGGAALDPQQAPATAAGQAR